MKILISMNIIIITIFILFQKILYSHFDIFILFLFLLMFLLSSFLLLIISSWISSINRMFNFIIKLVLLFIQMFQKLLPIQKPYLLLLIFYIFLRFLTEKLIVRLGKVCHLLRFVFGLRQFRIFRWLWYHLVILWLDKIRLIQWGTLFVL